MTSSPIELFTADQLYPPEIVAEKLAVSIDTIERGRQLKNAKPGRFDVPYLKIGVRVRYSGFELNAWIARNQIDPRAAANQKTFGAPEVPHPATSLGTGTISISQRRGRPTNRAIAAKKMARMEELK